MENTIQSAMDFIKSRKQTNPMCCETWSQIATMMVAYAKLTHPSLDRNRIVVPSEEEIEKLKAEVMELKNQLAAANELINELVN